MRGRGQDWSFQHLPSMPQPPINHAMSSNTNFPYLKVLKELLYKDLDYRTSAYLYGSFATGNWIADRSDLDLLLFTPETKLELLGEKIKTWQSIPNSPILDGFALFLSGGWLMAKRLEEFSEAAEPLFKCIQVIDLWNIKNRSVHIWGEAFAVALPDIQTNELSRWALGQMELFIGNLHIDDVPIIEAEPNGLIWSISWSARMLLLSRGIVCDSKLDAIRWLANEYSEIRASVDLLINNFSASGTIQSLLTKEESLKLRKFCVRIMQLEIQAR